MFSTNFQGSPEHARLLLERVKKMKEVPFHVGQLVRTVVHCDVFLLLQKRDAVSAHSLAPLWSARFVTSIPERGSFTQSIDSDAQ